MRTHTYVFIVAISASVLGALISQYLINNVSSVRRTVGGL